jgi:hypothetical protein
MIETTFFFYYSSFRSVVGYCSILGKAVGIFLPPSRIYNDTGDHVHITGIRVEIRIASRVIIFLIRRASLCRMTTVRKCVISSSLTSVYHHFDVIELYTIQIISTNIN